MKDKGYEAGEEEAEKIEDILARHQREENAIDYEEDVEHAERVKEPLPPSEPIYLYIKTGTGTYTVVDTIFNSRQEANQFAKENFPGQKYKVMNEQDIENYMAKLQRRQETVDRALGGAKKVAGGVLEASKNVASKYGMTKQKMQPRIERMWGAQPGPRQRPEVKSPAPEPQQPGINIQIGNRGVETKPPKEEPEPEYEEEYEHRDQSYRRPTMRMQPPTKPMRFGQPPRQRMRINIPPGGGVFQSRQFRPGPPPRRNVNISRGAGVYDKPPGIPRKAPIPRAKLNMGGLHRARPHTITPRGVRPMGRQPYEEVEETKTTRKYKTNKKSKKRKRG